MPIAFRYIKVGVRLLLNGRLHKDSYGGGLQNKVWRDYEVYISRIIDDEDRECPILLGDDYTNQLGWVSYDELTSECSYVDFSLAIY